MSSLNRLRKRSNVTNYSDDIYNQYTEDYQLYFDNVLNKTDYIDYYDTTIIGKGIVLDVSVNNAQNGDEKYITTLPNSKLYIGQILSLKFEDDIKYWLIIDKEHLAIPSHDKFKMRPCNYILKWMDKGVLYKMPVIIANQTKYTLGTSSQVAGITEGASRYQILMSFNSISKVIDEGQRFVFNNNAWKTTQVDFISEKGLLSILLGQDSINTEIDDTDNDIAGRWANKHTYTYNIPTNFEVSKDNTYQLLYSIKDELGKDFDYSLVSITTTNNTLVNITNNKGVITIKGIGIGIGSIKLSMLIGETMKDFDINFEVKEVVADKIDYQYKFSQGTTLKQYVSTLVDFTKIVGAISDANLLVNYTIDSNGNSLLNSNSISITRKTNTSFLIKNININTSKSFVITFVDNSDNEVILSQVINLTKGI